MLHQAAIKLITCENNKYRQISASIAKNAGGLLEMHIGVVCSVPLCYMVGFWVYAGLVQRIERCGDPDTSLSFALFGCRIFWHLGK